jgi:hypothetical protein
MSGSLDLASTYLVFGALVVFDDKPGDKAAGRKTPIKLRNISLVIFLIEDMSQWSSQSEGLEKPHRNQP